MLLRVGPKKTTTKRQLTDETLNERWIHTHIHKYIGYCSAALILIDLAEPLEEGPKREGRDGVTFLTSLLLPCPEDALADDVLIVQHVE